MENWSDQAAKLVKKGDERIREGYETVKEEADVMKKRIAAKGEDVREDTVKWIRRFPVEAVGLALAAGAALGAVARAVASSRREPASRVALRRLAHVKEDGLKSLKSTAERGLCALGGAIEELRANLR